MTATVAVLLTLAFVVSRQATPGRFEATGHRLLSDFPGGSGGASLSPDGNMVAFHRGDLDELGPLGNFQVWVKSVAGGQALQLTFDDALAASPCWSPKGDQILFNHRLGIWSVSPLGGAPRLVIERGMNPRFSADGDQVVFEDDRGIWIADSAGSHRRQIAPKAHAVPASPALSPDGRWVAFFQSEGGPFGDLWVVPSDGGSARRLTFDSSEGGGPVWTPDGRFVVFYSSRAGSQTLWRVPAQGGEPEPVTSGAGQDRDPDISADGKRLVYSNFRVTFALMLHDPATRRERELLQRRVLVSMPRFSPDGSRIAFAQRVDRDTHLFTVRVDGHDLRQITEGSGQQNVMPQWSADGAWIRYLRMGSTPSLRQVSALGGGSGELLSWPDGAAVEVDPSGHAIVYSKPSEKPSSTVVRNLTTGGETVFHAIVDNPRWSSDGQTIVGSQPGPSGAGSRVVLCAGSSRTCRIVTDDGVAPVMAGSGLRILFLRSPSPVRRMWGLWSIGPDGRDAKQVATLGPFGFDVMFDVARTGDIVYIQRRETRAELWQAELR